METSGGLGFLSGLVLERAGFGDSRNLSARFYLGDLRVLKVMFTAIVTAMPVLLRGSAAGLVDAGRLSVNPTYLGSAVAGGFVLGLGFIVGGYCPGTSVVAAATLELDGLAFLGGVAAGLLAFGETVPWFWEFWNGSGRLGDLTSPAWLGVDRGSWPSASPSWRCSPSGAPGSSRRASAAAPRAPAVRSRRRTVPTSPPRSAP